MIFETARLIVRPWRAEDAEEVFAIYHAPEVTRYLGATRAHDELAHSRAWLELIAARNEAAPFGLGLWAATLRGGGPPIGSVLLLPLAGGPEPEPEVEIGYHLGRDWWGQGYATELAARCLHHGFADLGLPRIVGVTFPEHLASQRVLRKIGLQYEGRRHRFGQELDYFALDAPAAPTRTGRG